MSNPTGSNPEKSERRSVLDVGSVDNIADSPLFEGLHDYPVSSVRVQPNQFVARLGSVHATHASQGGALSPSFVLDGTRGVKALINEHRLRGRTAADVKQPQDITKNKSPEKVSDSQQSTGKLSAEGIRQLEKLLASMKNGDEPSDLDKNLAAAEWAKLQREFFDLHSKLDDLEDRVRDAFGVTNLWQMKMEGCKTNCQGHRIF